MTSSNIRQQRSWSSSERIPNPQDPTKHQRSLSVANGGSIQQPAPLHTWVEEQPVNKPPPLPPQPVPKRKRHPPYSSFSIPSMIGSPLSFTQSFLASRSSVYGRQPPSSQIRAAHIDWDSLSMLEEFNNWHQQQIKQPPAKPKVESDELEIALRLVEEWEQQMVWDYACQHFPLLTSFSVAGALKVGSGWRLSLLVMVCLVMVGMPIGLVLLF